MKEWKVIASLAAIIGLTAIVTVAAFASYAGSQRATPLQTGPYSSYGPGPYGNGQYGSENEKEYPYEATPSGPYGSYGAYPYPPSYGYPPPQNVYPSPYDQWGAYPPQYGTGGGHE